MLKLPSKLLRNPLVTIQIDDDMEKQSPPPILYDSIDDITVSIEPPTPESLEPIPNIISIDKIPTNIRTSQISKNKTLANKLVKNLNLLSQYFASLKCNNSSSEFFNSETNVDVMNQMVAISTRVRDFLVTQSDEHNLNLAPPNSTLMASFSNVTKEETAKMIQQNADFQIINVLAPRKVRSHVTHQPLPDPKKTQTKYLKHLESQLKNLREKKKRAYHQDEGIQEEMRVEYGLKYDEKLNQIKELKEDQSVDFKLSLKRNLSEINTQNPNTKRRRITRSNNSRKDGV